MLIIYEAISPKAPTKITNINKKIIKAADAYKERG
jgi:hypothetical protein